MDTIQFPNRTTGIGSILDDYLSMKSEVHDKVRTFPYVIHEGREQGERIAAGAVQLQLRPCVPASLRSTVDKIDF